MLGVVARRALRAGLTSRSFTAEELTLKCEEADECVYIDVDDSGSLSLAGIQGLSGPAAIARAARLAPDIHARTAELVASSEGLRIRLLTHLPVGGELLVWFDETLLATVDMPFLTLKNIKGKKDYVCHDCDVQFERPNHLKVHLFLQCREFSSSVFWRRFHTKLTAACTPTDRVSAFRPYTDVINSPITAPAQLEALAAEWGKSTNGHLCLYCGKVYSRKYGLKIHIRTHTGYKPLRCRFCLRAFGDPSNLNKHVRLHASDSPGGAGEHACPVCGKRLARRRDLLRHVRARHANALTSTATSPCAVP